MTLDEIKASVKMEDVARMYGLSSRRGVVCCPFHGERNPSMKLYTDGFKCFSCGEHGDVIDFVRGMERCDFKTAFAILGGTHEKSSSRMKELDAKRRAVLEEKKRRAEAVKLLNLAITKCRCTEKALAPGGVGFEYLQIASDYLPILLGFHEELMGEEVLDYGEIRRKSAECIEKLSVFG